MFYTNSQGLNISYRETGDPAGRPVLFFDGWPAPYEIMANRMAKELAAVGYRCIEFDYRGYGKSDASASNSMEWCALDARELLEHLQISKAVFFGGSMGLSVILAYCKAFGDQYIDRIIAFDQPASVSSREGWSYGRKRGRQDLSMLLSSVAEFFHDPMAFIAKDGAETSVEAYPELDLPESYRQEFGAAMMEYGKSLTSEEQANLMKMQTEGPLSFVDPLALIATWFDSGYQDYRAVLPEIKVPVLFFAPNPGSLYPFEASEYYRDHLGGEVTFVELKPATHLCLMERFPEMKEAVLDYLRGGSNG